MIILLKKFALFLSVLFLFPMNVYASDCSATSAVVIDADTGIILYEKNAYEERAIASTTKIITALIAIESNRLNEQVKITAPMLKTEGTSLGLREGDKLTLYDLVTGMMLTSGNDSANAVAYFISGSIEGFSVIMNRRAAEIGMKNSFFVTPSGLDAENHHSTAYDMALLTAAAVKSDVFCEIVSKKSAEITIGQNKITVYNHNKLLAMDENFFGVKTGFTKKAGRCLVSAKKYEGNKLICVTLNAPDDWNDHKILLKECESKYRKTEVSSSVKIPAVGAQKNEISVSLKKEYYLLEDVNVKLYYYPFVYAPVKKGDKIGTACVYYHNKLLERLPIEADEDLNYYVKQE